MTWRVGDTGLTGDHKPYEILSVSFVGGPGPILARVRRNEVDWAVRYTADGKHPGGLD